MILPRCPTQFSAHYFYNRVCDIFILSATKGGLLIAKQNHYFYRSI